ncbi:MAG: 1,4-dihydroxy-2-naphthoate octaprenyltransferase [Candidatus Geothermarchaeales archaeon]
MARPKALEQSLAGRKANVIFSHITPLPGGGYTERRYIVLWGEVAEEGEGLLFSPMRYYRWDEREVPFPQYCEISVPQARRYMKRLGEEENKQVEPHLPTPWLILRATRLPFLVATWIPVLLGTAFAAFSGFLDLNLFILTLLGASLAHLGVNTANDFFDYRQGADMVNVTPTPYSGGSRVIQYGLASPGQMLGTSVTSVTLAVIVGLYLAFTRGFAEILLLTALGTFIIVFYTASPIRLVYRGLGELAVGFAFGPLIVTGTYFVQAQAFSLQAVLASLPVGILVAMILYVNEIPDIRWDRKAGKKTLPVRLEREDILKGYTWSLVVTYGVVLLGVASGIMPPITVLMLVAVPYAVKVHRAVEETFGDPYAMMPTMSSNIKLMILTGILLTAAYVLAAVFPF